MAPIGFASRVTASKSHSRHPEINPGQVLAGMTFPAYCLQPTAAKPLTTFCRISCGSFLRPSFPGRLRR